MTDPSNHPSRRMPDGPPSGYFMLMRGDGDGDQAIELTRLLSAWATDWRTLLLAGLLGGLIAAALSLLLRNEYRASVLVIPITQDQGAASALRGQLGGLAALAGVELGGGSASKKEEALATLRSAQFMAEFIQSEGLMQILFEDEWDGAGKRWRDAGDPPTLQDGLKLFREKVVSVSEDRKTGLVTVSVQWFEPELAARWANDLVARANEGLRAEAIADAARSIEYLNSELAKTQVVELQQAIYRLIESQVNVAMLANVRPEYAFRVIDPAVPPDLKRKVAPKRALLAIGGAFLAGFLASCWVLWRRRREWLPA